MSDNPFQPNPGNFRYEAQQPQYGSDSSRVQPPSIALMVAGGVNMLTSLYGVIMSAYNTIYPEQQQALQRQQLDEAMRQNPGLAEFFEGILAFISLMNGPVGLIWNSFILAIGGFIMFGGWKMMNLQAYGIAMTASILAVIPCISSCCFVGLPIGIWCIVVLSDAAVKNAFQR